MSEETIELGIAFQELKKNVAMQVLLEDLQKKAEKAREHCTSIDPLEYPKQLYAEQQNVRLFKTLIEVIDSYIVKGKQEQEAREQREDMTDD